jgi:hypothetical protein
MKIISMLIEKVRTFKPWSKKLSSNIAILKSPLTVLGILLLKEIPLILTLPGSM